MSAFRKFETKAIRLMACDLMSESLLDAVLAIEAIDRYEYTGSGYYLTVSHPDLPSQGSCLGDPPVAGVVGEIQSGFVVHLGNNELTLECHTWGPVDVPENFRDLDVEVISPPRGFVDHRSQPN